MTLKENFDYVLEKYIDFKASNAKMKPFSPIISDIPSQLHNMFDDKSLTYACKGSNGVGIFSDVPWIMINDPSVCQSAKDGL